MALTLCESRTMNKLILIFTVCMMTGMNLNAQINLQAVDSIIQRATSKHFFEGTVLLAENGRIVYHRSFGFKDMEQSKPICNASRFSIASITKLFTAIITLQLIEEGKFELTDDLETLLPELNIPQSPNITVHHLLLHISGLPNENDSIYAQAKNPRDFVAETIANRANSIGEFNYTNLDYVLLGLIIEKFDNMSFAQSVHRRMLAKYSMLQTGFLEKGKYPEDFAYSFSFSEDGMRKADPLLFIENYYAAGCMYSTAEDLLKLDQALYGSDLLSENSKALMFTSYPEYNYSGYSVWTYNYPFAPSKPRVMERRGSILGANAVLLRYLELNKTIIILSNNNQFNPSSFGNTESLKEALMIAFASSR
jgi:D-alanyl-D-alanine carboxypeptidase